MNHHVLVRFVDDEHKETLRTMHLPFRPDIGETVRIANRDYRVKSHTLVVDGDKESLVVTILQEWHYT